MNLLVVGASLQFTALLHALWQAPEHVITQCEDGAGAVVELRRNAARYDWIIVSGQTTAFGSMRIARAIRATGTHVPISILSNADEMGLPPGWRPPPETSPHLPAKNIYAFYDAMYAATSDTNAASATRRKRPGLVLHYHAAPKKRRLS